MIINGRVCFPELFNSINENDSINGKDKYHENEALIISLVHPVYIGCAEEISKRKPGTMVNKLAGKLGHYFFGVFLFPDAPKKSASEGPELWQINQQGSYDIVSLTHQVYSGCAKEITNGKPGITYGKRLIDQGAFIYTEAPKSIGFDTQI